MSRFLAIAAVLVMAVGVAQASGIVQLPVAGLLCSQTGSVLSSGALTDFLRNYGYLSLFILMAAESASVPIPSEVILPVAGYLASTGAMGSLPLLLAVSTAAALVGALLDYYLAKFLGRPFVEGILRLFRVEKSRLDRAGEWFERSGQWTVFAARFVPLVRALISFPAGLFEMGLGEFVVMTVVGCAIWNAILLYAGFVFGQSICSGQNGAFVVDGFAAVLAAASAAYVLYYVAMSRRKVKDR